MTTNPAAESESPEHWQFSIKALFLIVTSVCVVAASGIYLGPWAVMLIPLGLAVFWLVQDRWALAVVGLYGLILMAITVPLASAAFGGEMGEGLAIFAFPPYYLWLEVMLVSQAALLVVPVAKVSRRNVKRHSLVWPLLSSGLMMGAMVMGAIWAIHEFIYQGGGDGWLATIGFWSWPTVWLLWTAVFFLFSRRREPMDVVSRQCRLLLQGSILELLIAIPTHIIARQRDYCCAGLMTFVGLTFGVSVMLFSFGPAVFFLFVARWRHVHPPHLSETDRPEPHPLDADAP